MARPVNRAPAALAPGFQEGVVETSIVFYRNMNFGHPGSPTRDSLLSILKDAGAEQVESVQTNGTVLLKAMSPERVIGLAAPVLLSKFGYPDVAVIRSLSAVQSFLDRCQIEGITDPTVYRLVLTFFGGAVMDVTLPWTNQKGDVDVLAVEGGMAFCIIRKPRASAGNATVEMERLSRSPATTRSISTLRRCIGLASSF
ncbi:MAG: DUF1697 domain-containing protein [Burkholderiaceae bacterium]|jgi:uncharacterized protein (DUF1697 family)|nr:DUF1697 domain-containing protein [Burkholderiaceae bacterium]